MPYKGLLKRHFCHPIVRGSIVSLVGGHTAGVNKVRNRCLYHESGCKPPWHQFDEGMFRVTHEEVRQFIDTYKGTL